LLTTFFASRGENNTYLWTTFISTTRLIAILIKKKNVLFSWDHSLPQQKRNQKYEQRIVLFTILTMPSQPLFDAAFHLTKKDTQVSCGYALHLAAPSSLQAFNTN